MERKDREVKQRILSRAFAKELSTEDLKRVAAGTACASHTGPMGENDDDDCDQI